MTLLPKTSYIRTAVIFTGIAVMFASLTANMLGPAYAQDDAQDNTQEGIAPSYDCIPAIKIVADLGYCFGFTLSYFDAINNAEILNAVGEKGIAANIAAAHGQCYATNFTSQQKLGELAFASYINLEDETLLTRTAADCRIMLDYYAKQRQSPPE